LAPDTEEEVDEFWRTVRHVTSGGPTFGRFLIILILLAVVVCFVARDGINFSLIDISR
jgi:hypothetical protein